MNKLTLPIQVGKKYLRRDGEIATTPQKHFGVLTYIADRLTVFVNTGKYSTDGDHPYDLVADYIKPAVITPAPTGHIHAASMLLYAQDAAETDKPWERWEINSVNSGEWRGHASVSPLWIPDRKYRRKPTPPAFIDINGFRVPEPMRVVPKLRTQYWYVNLCDDGKYPSTWDGGSVDNDRLTNGFCHYTGEAAVLHTKALLSFTQLK